MSNKSNTWLSIRNIIIFTILVNGLAWLGPLLGGDPSTPGLGFLLWGIAPIASALVIKIILRDPVSLGFRPSFKGNGRWYALSILVFPVTIAIVLGLGLVFSSTTIRNFTLPIFISAMIPLAVTYLIFALFEEVGWRGYLSPKMYGLNDGLIGHCVIGLIWASWHIPYFRELWSHTSEELVTLLPRFLLGTIVLAVVYGEIRIRTGSVWPAVLMHWVGNSIANPLVAGFVLFSAGKEYLGSVGVDGLFMIAFFGLLGVAINRWRSRKTSAQKSLS